MIITFDDGFRNFYTNVAPHLVEDRIPVTVFLITDSIVDHGDARLDAAAWSPKDDETHLSWAEVLALRRRYGFQFGSHTCSHLRLPTLSPEELDRELRDSYLAMTSHGLEETGVALAYPKGEYSTSVVDQASRIGYLCGLTTDPGVNGVETDLFSLKRVLIGDDDSIPIFAARVSGLTGWFERIRGGDLRR